MARAQVAQAEEMVNPVRAKVFAFDAAGFATIDAAGTVWRPAGSRRCRSGNCESGRVVTRQAIRACGQGSGCRRRKSRSTDIGSLQATANRSTLFQVASQFNCLESPGPYVTPVARSFDDSTQGPRAVRLGVPRHAPPRLCGSGPRRRTLPPGSTNGPQIELLADACGPGVAPNGYLTGEEVPNPEALAEVLEARFDAIRVGVHDGAQVVLGYNWDGAVEDYEHRHISKSSLRR